MKTYEINITGQVEQSDVVSTHYIKTDAEKMDVQTAINFLQNAPGQKTIDSLLIALRVLGFKATEIKVQAEESFDL